MKINETSENILLYFALRDSMNENVFAIIQKLKLFHFSIK